MTTAPFTQTPLQKLALNPDSTGDYVYPQTKTTAVKFIKICKNNLVTAGETVKLLFKNFEDVDSGTLSNLIRFYYKA